MNRPQPKITFSFLEGCLWRHIKTGDVYVVTGNGFIEAECKQAVFYRRVNTPDSVVWVRPAREFQEKFERLQVPLHRIGE